MFVLLLGLGSGVRASIRTCLGLGSGALLLGLRITLLGLLRRSIALLELLRLSTALLLRLWVVLNAAPAWVISWLHVRPGIGIVLRSTPP